MNNNLPSFDSQKDRIDERWSKVNSFNEYPALCKLVFALLSSFHGPAVDSSLNVIGEIIDVKSAKSSIETYSSYQAVNYKLKSFCQNAITFFRKDDFKKDWIDSNLLNNMVQSKKDYKKEKESARNKMEERKKKLDAQKNETACKRNAKELATRLAKKARLDRRERMMKKAKSKKSCNT